MACAVTSDLNRYIAECDEDQARNDAIEAKLAELMSDPKVVADAFDRALDNRVYKVCPKTGEFTNTPLAEYFAEKVIDGSRFAAAFLMDHLRELARIELDNLAEDLVDADSNRSAIDAAEARLRRDEGDAA